MKKNIIILILLFSCFLILYTIKNISKNGVSITKKLDSNSRIVKIINFPRSNKEDNGEAFEEERDGLNNLFKKKNNILRCTDINKIVYPRLIKIENSDSSNNECYIYGNHKYDLIKTSNNQNLDYDEYVFKENDQIIIETKLDKWGSSNSFEGYIIDGFPVFSFNEFLSETNSDLREIKNIYYKGENYSKKYKLLATTNLFEYNNKLGFFGGDEFGEYIFYDDKKYLLDFGLIMFENCCMNLYQEMRICSNGIFSFLSQKNGELNIVEIDLNKL